MANEHPKGARSAVGHDESAPGAGPPTPITSVVVAVLTYQRSEHLAELLTELLGQAAGPGFKAEVLVVDNNPTAIAEPVVTGFAEADLHYVHEPEPGIAAGRNRALEWSVGRDAIVFIDDDETPSAEWLSNLVITANSAKAAGVTGPVERQYPAAPSLLVTGMRRWDRVRRQTGARVPAASTANLLLDLRFLRSCGLSFDPGFGLSGGSDTLLTRQLVRAGGSLVWCDEAIVIDHVVAERLTPTWLLRRGRRVGNTHARVTLVLDAGQSTRAALLAKGMALRLWGTGGVLAGRIMRDPERAGAGLWRRARGRGIVDGAIGRTHYDYRRPTT